MDEQLSFIKQIASNTFYRREDDKFSFLWDTHVVILYYNEDSKMFRVISNHEPQVLTEINNWLNGFVKSIANVSSDDLEVTEEF